MRGSAVEMLNLRSAPEERLMSTGEDPIQRRDFLESLSSFSKLHRSQKWEGTFGEFLTDVVAKAPAAAARSSHQYIWDMLRWHGQVNEEQGDSNKARALFRRELFGIDEPLSRVVDYFKAAAAGSDVGRRLLLLLGPPSGGK
jgi:serine protein kinase